MIITQKDAIKAIESGKTLKRNDGSLVYSLENNFNKLTAQYINKDCETQFEPYPQWWLDYKITEYKVNKMTEKTINRLNQKQVWEISKKIESDIELYRDTEYKFIANEMNKIFDYEITVSNIQHIKEVTGLQIGKPSKRPVSTAQEDIKAAHEDIKAIANLLLSVKNFENIASLLDIVNRK